MSEFLAGHHYKELEQMPPEGTSELRPAGPKAWFEKFIKELRVRYEALPEDSRRGVVLLDDFGPPCQVLVFWVREPERQYIFVTKERSIPDLTVEIHGPVDIGQSLTEIGKILQEPWLQKVVPTDGTETTYHDELERDLIGMVRMLQYEVFHPEMGGAGSIIKRGPEHCKWFTWFVVGNLTSTDPKGLSLSVSQQWIELKDRTNAPVQPVVSAPSPEATETIRGYCTYVLPPTWFGKLPRPDYTQKLYGIPILSPLAFQTLTSYKGRVLGFGMLGQFAIGEPDKLTCRRYMNEIMAVASLLGLSMAAVRESDLGEIQMSREGQIRSVTYPESPARRRLSQMEFGGMDEASLATFREVALERLTEIVKVAEKAIDSAVKSDCANLLVEARTLIEGGEYSQAFVSCWLALEIHFIELWRSTNPIEGKPLPARKERIGFVLKKLHSKSIIDDQQFLRLERLRKKRNEISHQGSTTSREEAGECYRESVTVIGRTIGLISRGSIHGRRERSE